MAARLIGPRLAPLGLVAGVVILPLVTSGYMRGVLVLSGVFVVAVVGLALQVGHAGQLSLAQGAFFALGAYAYAIGGARLHWPPPFSLLVGTLGVALVAWSVGVLLARLRGHFLALGTLAFASIVVVGLQQFGDWTRGPSGLSTTARLVPPLPPLSRDVLSAWLVWAAAGLALVAFERLIRGEVGSALSAVRSSEIGATAVGIDAHRLRLATFILAAAFAAVAGALYADYVTYISPAAFDVLLGVQLVVMVVVGGAANYRGPLLGAIVVTALVEVLRGVVPLVLPGVHGPVELMGLSVVLGLVTLLKPRGLASVSQP